MTAITGRHVAEPDVIHVAGMPFVTYPPPHLARQRCAWCGALILEAHAQFVRTFGGGHAVLPGVWDPGVMVAVAGERQWQVTSDDPSAAPLGSCWALDPAVTR
jgi:hypothetical protein